jgi:hypothetical protein
MGGVVAWRLIGKAIRKLPSAVMEILMKKIATHIILVAALAALALGTAYSQSSSAGCCAKGQSMACCAKGQTMECCAHCQKACCDAQHK